MTHLLSRGITAREGKILLAYYIEKGYWFLPGGHIEPGESGARALIRECQEEMNINISSPTALTTFEHAYEDKEEIQHEITIIYKFDVALEENVDSQIPHLTFDWVSEEKFAEIKFLPKALKEPMQGYLSGETMPQFVSTLE